MKSIDIKVALRKSTGKKDSRKLRKNDQVPCVLYGGKENLHFYTEEKAFKNLVYTHHVYVINLDVEGKMHKAIMKEIQFHPVTDRINHIDFIEVTTDKPLIVDIPVEITGNSVGIRAGGKLRQRKRYIKVKGLIENIPDSLVIDISDIDIGQSILAGDLKYDNIEILESGRTLVVGVVTARAVIAETEEVTATAAGAAPAEGVAPAEVPAPEKKK